MDAETGNVVDVQSRDGKEPSLFGFCSVRVLGNIRFSLVIK